MAAEGDLDKEVAIHRQGYDKFIGMLKFGAIACFIIAMLVIFLISR